VKREQLIEAANAAASSAGGCDTIVLGEREPSAWELRLIAEVSARLGEPPYHLDEADRP
jgi:hypothetical protein